MIRLILWVLTYLALSSIPAMAAPTAADFAAHAARAAAVGQVRWHIDNANPGQRGPLIIWLPGSGAMPFFQTFSDGSRGYLFPVSLLEYRDAGHFMMVEKPGVPFEAKVELDPVKGRPVPLDSREYRAGLSQRGMVARAALAIRQARKAMGNRITGVVIIGGSEGGQYAFALARAVKADLAVVWGGIALPQYFDLIIDQRLKAERGEITRVAAQAEVERIYGQIETIQRAPKSVEVTADGDPNLRWSTFGTYSAVDDMLALKIPLLLIQGGNDRNAPIINSDFAKVAFLSRGRTNLDYWVYPDADHGFRVPATGGGKAASIQKEVWDRAWGWITDHLGAARTGGGKP